MVVFRYFEVCCRNATWRVRMVTEHRSLEQETVAHICALLYPSTALGLM